jgi:hypothetical protein
MPADNRTTQPVEPYSAPGSAGRLARYRGAAWERVATIAANHGDGAARLVATMRADDWRDAARGRFSRSHGGNWQALDGCKYPFGRAYYADSFAALGWRDLGTAEEVSRAAGSRAVEARGWYCDAHESGTISGHVLQLPAVDGVARYVAGVSWSDCDGVTVYPCRPHETALDAARSADGYAENLASEGRDYSAAWSAGSYFAHLGQEIATARREALAILAERRAVRGITAPALCSAIRAQVQAIIDRISEARGERTKLASGESEGLWFYPGDSRLRDAFSEGAGEPIPA